MNFSELVVRSAHHGLHPRQIADVRGAEHDLPSGGFDFFNAADHAQKAIIGF